MHLTNVFSVVRNIFFKYGIYGILISFMYYGLGLKFMRLHLNYVIKCQGSDV